jgi:hypothetical protein
VRRELSIAFSEDDGVHWTRPVVFARHPKEISYPHVFEAQPGLLWITTLRGPLRCRLHEQDMLAAAAGSSIAAR